MNSCRCGGSGIIKLKQNKNNAGILINGSDEREMPSEEKMWLQISFNNSKHNK